MRSVFIIVVILWFCTRIVTAFRITNELNIDNLTSKTFDGSNNSGSQDNQTIDEFVEIENSGNIANDTLNIDGPTPPGMATIIGKINTRTNLDHTDQHSALVESSRDPVRGIIFRQKVKPEARSFFGLIIIPYIVCFFAAKGFWPFYPPMLQYQVNEMGKKIFALSDDRVKQFCRGKFNFQETCYRPVWYKGYFVPVDAPASTDCPTECPPIQPVTTIATAPTPATSAQSWGDAPAKLAVKPKPHHSDVELFDANGKLTTAKPKLEALDGEKQQQSNVNIEIHNVFSFGTANNSLLPPESLSPQQQQQHQSPLNGQTDNKISLPNDSPQIIYA